MVADRQFVTAARAWTVALLVGAGCWAAIAYGVSRAVEVMWP